MAETSKRKATRSLAMKVIATCWIVFQIYIVFFVDIPSFASRAIHVSFACAMLFLMKPLSKTDKVPAFIFDCASSVFFIASAVFMYFRCDSYMSRISFISKIDTIDMVVATIFIVLLIEASRRSVGRAMTIVVLVFVVYAFFGDNLTGVLTHRGISYSAFVEIQYLSTSGLFGTAASVSVDTVFYFMIFGAFLAATPAGKLFISIAKYVNRKAIGGACKTAIFASALFGMISGSASANVAASGSLTYDAMEKSGVKPIFAASVLAMAGSGGQLIPPIMGAAAFLMADLLQISYFSIIKFAIIPAVLYVATLYFLVHFEAKKQDIQPEECDVEDLKHQIKSYFYLLLPMVLLVYLIADGRSLMYSAIISLIFLVALCALKKETRMSIKDIHNTLMKGARDTVGIAIPSAVSGIVVGVLSYTGLGLKISSLIASMSGGNLFIALLLTMVMIVIMGMGMPTSSAYIMSAVILAPALTSLGIELVVAHMFIFYFANLSMLTPPVALASYTAAGIAKTPFWQTGIEAFRLSLVLFAIPFVFVYSPALLMIGTVGEIIMATVPTFCALIATVVAMVGYFDRTVGVVGRVLFALAALLMFLPVVYMQATGVVLFVVLILQQKRPLAKVAA